MENILSNISDLFVGNGIIIIIGCMIVGLFVKGTIKKVPNKFIPFINIIISIILGFIIPGTYEDRDIISKVIILIFLGLSSVGLYEALCIILKDRFSIDVKKITNKFFSDTKIDENIVDNSNLDYQEDILDESEE